MQDCPAVPVLSSPSTSHPGLERLVQWVDALLDGRISVDALSELEQWSRDLTMTVEREVIAAWLQRKDIDAPAVLIDGSRHTRVMRSETTVHTSAGDIKLHRTLYRSSPSEPCRDPMALQAGLIEGRWTPMAAKQAIWATAHLTPKDAAEMFEMSGGMVPSKSALDRLAKRVSAWWEGQRPTFEAQLRQQAIIPQKAVTVCISLDGVLLPMKDGQRAQKRMNGLKMGKKPCGPAGYREVGCGTISFYDLDGERLESWRHGRMPQKNKLDLKDWLRCELGLVLEQRPRLTIVKISDGALDNWTFLDSAQLPDGIGLVDFFHAVSHLSSALASAYGEGTPRYRARFSSLRRRLRDDGDGVDKIIRSLRHLRAKHPKRKTILRELRYFRRYRHHMRYAQASEQELPIGSGVVEAACKTLVTERMKRSGMRWRHQGGQAILTFRGWVQSGRFETAWRLISESYSATVQLPPPLLRLVA